MTEETVEKMARMQEEIDKLRMELAQLKSNMVEMEDENIPTTSLAVINTMDEATEDADLKAETLCRWAAARAGVIVVAPLVGTVALMANEVYLIGRIARIYNVKLSERAVIAFLGAMSGRMAGNLLITLIPIGAMQIPIAIGITYSLGKVTQRWLKDGMPSDLRPYASMLVEWKDNAKVQVDKLRENPLQNVPLGDETIDFMKKWSGAAKDLVADVKDKGQKFVYNARHCEDELIDEIAQEKARQDKETVPDAPKTQEAPPTQETSAQDEPIKEQVRAAMEEAKAPLDEQK